MNKLFWLFVGLFLVLVVVSAIDASLTIWGLLRRP